MTTEDCCQTVPHSRIVLKDEGSRSTATILNPQGNEICRCRVDGCLVTAGRKCDFLVQEIGKWTILIELKGGDLPSAVDQFEQTLRSQEMKSILSGKIAALAVCTKVRIPNATAYLLKCKQKFMRDYGVKFHTKSGSGEFCPYQLSGAPR